MQFTCSRCGVLDNNEVVYWENRIVSENYTVTGINDYGEVTISQNDTTYGDVQNTHFECLYCGEHLNEDFVVDISY